jgi:hypothetical protein
MVRVEDRTWQRRSLSISTALHVVARDFWSWEFSLRVVDGICNSILALKS